MMSRLPFRTSRKPRIDASAQNASYGLANARNPPTTYRIPSAMWAHFQLGRTTAIIPSFSPAMRNTTPRRAPTVAIDVVSNRSTINPMISQAIPVMRNNHQTLVMAPNI